MLLKQRFGACRVSVLRDWRRDNGNRPNHHPVRSHSTRHFQADANGYRLNSLLHVQRGRDAQSQLPSPPARPAGWRAACRIQEGAAPCGHMGVHRGTWCSSPSIARGSSSGEPDVPIQTRHRTGQPAHACPQAWPLAGVASGRRRSAASRPVKANSQRW